MNDRNRFNLARLDQSLGLDIPGLDEAVSSGNWTAQFTLLWGSMDDQSREQTGKMLRSLKDRQVATDMIEASTRL